MKFAFLLSGALGFFLVSVVGLGSGRDLEPVLRDAALACLVCAFVGRWFWSALETAFARALAERRAAAEAAEAAEIAAQAAAPSPASAPAGARPPAAVPAKAATPSQPKSAAAPLAGAARR